MTSREVAPSLSSSSFSFFNFDRYRNEVNVANGKDNYRKLVDNTKKRAVYQAGSYDEFKSLVATCHLKPLEKNEVSILTSPKPSLLPAGRKKNLNRGISQAYETTTHSYLIQNRSSRCSSSCSSTCIKTGLLASGEEEDTSVQTSLSSFSSSSSSDEESDEDKREVGLGKKEGEERREKEEKRSSREKKDEETKESRDDVYSGSSGVCTPDDCEGKEDFSFSSLIQKDDKDRAKYLSVQEKDEMKRSTDQTSSLFPFGLNPSGFSLMWNSHQTDLEKVTWLSRIPLGVLRSLFQVDFDTEIYLDIFRSLKRLSSSLKKKKTKTDHETKEEEKEEEEPPLIKTPQQNPTHKREGEEGEEEREEEREEEEKEEEERGNELGGIVESVSRVREEERRRKRDENKEKRMIESLLLHVVNLLSHLSPSIRETEMFLLQEEIDGISATVQTILKKKRKNVLKKKKKKHGQLYHTEWREEDQDREEEEACEKQKEMRKKKKKKERDFPLDEEDIKRIRNVFLKEPM